MVCSVHAVELVRGTLTHCGKSAASWVPIDVDGAPLFLDGSCTFSIWTTAFMGKIVYSERICGIVNTGEE